MIPIKDIDNNKITLSDDVSLESIAFPNENQVLLTFKPREAEKIAPSVSPQKKASDFTSEYGEPQLPDAAEIAEYLQTKNNFQHSSAELHQKFLGRTINSRNERQLYYKFRNIIDKAKNIVEKQYNGEWHTVGFDSVGDGRVKITEYKKKNNGFYSVGQ